MHWAVGLLSVKLKVKLWSKLQMFCHKTLESQSQTTEDRQYDNNSNFRMQRFDEKKSVLTKNQYDPKSECNR